MNNEPVVWVPKDHLKEIGKKGFKYTGVSCQEDKFYNIPLYTHPAKTLTDEEIKEIWTGTKWSGFEPIELTFARAILRKAQK